MIIEIALGTALGGMLTLAGLLYICTNTNIIRWYAKKSVETMKEVEKVFEDEGTYF